MSEPTHQEVAVLNAALEFRPAERAAYLDEACAGDAGLRQQVEALLRADAAAEGFLEALPAGLGVTRTVRVTAPLTEKAGDRIGRYKLLQQIGEGGCGVVYMAEQEEPVRRRVALKVIKLGMDTKQVIARFEAERQALAMMDHQNIAKVLEAGATETGRPYFVMELVRGIKITDFCDENNLPTADRLQLFIQVCQAIQHAHQKGVIHRDIKPSNILVTINDGVPVPKVIDFGIAKATQGRLTDQTLFTAFEQFIGTPAYMSPEQAVLTSLDIDTRSDIYSLGVLLYELLTGRTPFDAQELMAAGLDAMRRTIREQEPPKPSTRLGTMAADALTTTAKHQHTDAPKLIHLLRGDLDWIVMKSLEKDRARRYETATGLAVDIERFLKDEPIEAVRPSMVYSLGKLFKRRRKEAAVAVLVLALVSCAAVIGMQQRHARTTHQAAQLVSWRREELETLGPVAGGQVWSGPEKEYAQVCLTRLAERVSAGRGSRSDEELLARVLTREVRLEGRPIQTVAEPWVNLSAVTGSGYAVRGVAAVVDPVVTVMGKPVTVSDYPVYLTGGSGGRSSVGQSGIVRVGEVLKDVGTRRLSCTLRVQLVYAKGTSEYKSSVQTADYQPIGDPLTIAGPSRDFLFVDELPREYPIEILDTTAVGRVSEALLISSPIVSEKGNSREIEIEITVRDLVWQLPLALKFELLRIGQTPLQGCFCGLVFYKNGQSLVQLAGSHLVFYGINMGGAGKYLLRFDSGSLQGLEPGKHQSARIRISSSRAVALETDEMDYFLSFPELERTISGGLGHAEAQALLEGQTNAPAETKSQTH